MRVARDPVQVHLALQFARKELGTDFVPPFAVLGIEDRFGIIRGAAVFNDFCDRNIELTCVGRGAFSRDVCRELARIAFNVNGAERSGAPSARGGGTTGWWRWPCGGGGRSRGSCGAGTATTTRWCWGC